MSDETVRPALTAEEWRTAAVRRSDTGIPPLTEAYIYAGSLNAARGDDAVMIDKAALHALAALALHEQPFGFTRDDVKLLRGPAYSALLEVARDGEESALADDALALARRIAALLPPEEATPTRRGT